MVPTTTFDINLLLIVEVNINLVN